MPNPSTSAAGWPPGWRPATKRAWRARGLDVEQARLFRDSGWTPSAALDGVSELADDEIELLRSDAPPTIRPGSVVRDVLRLHRAGVTPATNDWDTAAADILDGLGWPQDVAGRLHPGDDPVLTVLTALHELDAEPPADVALARHCHEGCHCDGARFPTYLGIVRIEQAEQDHTVVMTTDEGTTLQIRTGRYLAARIDAGPWVRLPDLASACWYLHKTAQDDDVVVEVDGSTAGLRCVTAMAQLNPVDGDLEIDVAGTTLTWDGSALLPGYDVPDWMVIASSYWEGDSGTPMNSGGTTYLIESNGTHYFGGDEMGWTEVGPFDCVSAEAWFRVQIGAADPSSEPEDEKLNEQ